MEDCVIDLNKMKYGLIAIIKEHQVPVPLKKVQLDVKIIDFIAQVTLIQEYVNEEDNVIEVQYSYPVEESAAVVGFEAMIDGRDIVTEVKEKQIAIESYNKAMKVCRFCIGCNAFSESCRLLILLFRIDIQL